MYVQYRDYSTYFCHYSQHLATSFLLNGYDDLDIFSELDDHDLDTLHISDLDHRNKILSAAHILNDWNGNYHLCTCTLL